MKHNYNLDMKDIISKLDKVPKLLLHSCCGPCSTTVISILSNYFYVDVLYYNPKEKKNKLNLFMNLMENIPLN